MYNRDEVRAQNEHRQAKWPRSILWALAALVGAPSLAYNLWTLLDPLIHFNADPIGLFVPLILGSVALWKAMRAASTWVKLVVVPIYFVLMGVFLFTLAFAWACGHGRGCV